MTDTQDCKFCNRRGLPLLPLRLAYVPGGLDNLPGPMAGNPKLALGMSEGKYMLRVINEGYVYTYDARDTVGWRCFAATPDGRLREVVLADEGRPAQAPAFRCAMKGHALDASIASVQDPLDAREVWVGYFRTWLTKAARKNLKTDAALRGQLMMRIDPHDLVTGAPVAPADGLRISASGDELKRHVWEYENPTQAGSRYAYTGAAVVDRAAEAQAQAARMHQISPGNAIALALADPVGVVQDISRWRNFKAGELAKLQTERQTLRELVVADVITGLQKQCEDAKQPEHWARLAKHVDMNRVTQVREAHRRKVEAFERVLCRCGADWKAWITREDFWNAWKAYDGAERTVGLDQERDFTTCVFGSGAVKDEQAVWDQVLAANLQSNRNALWLGLAAGDKKVLDFLQGKGDTGVDIWKNARDGRQSLGDWLMCRRQDAAVRAATQETGLLGNVIASQAARLFEKAPDQAHVVGLRLRIIAAARMDIEVTPYRWRVSARELIAASYETIWGPPTPQLTQRMIEARRLRVVQGVDGLVLGSKASVAQTVEIDLWLPKPVADKLMAQGRLPAPSRAATGAGPVLQLPGPAMNPMKGFMGWLRQNKASAGLVGLGGALQMWNLSNTLGTLRTAALVGDAEAVKEAYFGIASGISGLGGVTAEVVASSVNARVVPAVTQVTSARLLTVVGWTTLSGGLLAMGAAWAEGAASLYKWRRLSNSGDTDAAKSAFLAGGFLLLSGAAGASVAIANAGVAFAAAGVTASSGGVAATIVGMSSAGTVLLGIPVWGWIALGVVALVAGVWFLFKGSQEEDTPLEVWLSRCCLRNERQYAATDRRLFPNAAAEMESLQQALFGLQVTLDWKDRLGKDLVEIQVVMPGFGASSDFAYVLELSDGRHRTTLVDRKASAMSSDPDLMPRPTQHFISATPPGRRLIPMDEVLIIERSMALRAEQGGGVLSGAVRANESYYDRVKLKLEYWPDVVGRPNLKMVPMRDGQPFTPQVTD